VITDLSQMMMFKNAVGGGGSDQNTLLLLHFDGADGGDVFTDSSIYNKTIQKFYTPTTTNLQSKFGGTSLKNDTSNARYLMVVGYSELNFTNKIATVEFWYYKTSVAGARIVHNQASGTDEFYFGQTGGGANFTVNGGGASFSTPNTNVPLNQWVHIAGVWDGTKAKLFIDGVLIGTSAANITGNLNANITGTFYIGGSGFSGAQGYVDELRISNVARYTSNFTPPTAPFTG